MKTSLGRFELRRRYAAVIGKGWGMVISPALTAAAFRGNLGAVATATESNVERPPRGGLSFRLRECLLLAQSGRTT
jgi:hypothetical protein